MLLNKFSTHSGMGLTPYSEINQTPPIWQDPAFARTHSIAGGGKIVNVTELNTVIPKGTPVLIDETLRTATISIRLKVYETEASGSAVQYKVYKAHLGSVGMKLMKAPATQGGTATGVSITVIDDSNADYDLITVDSTLGALTAGDILGEAAAAGAGVALLAEPNGLTYDDRHIEAAGITYMASAVQRGVVFERRIIPLAPVDKLALSNGTTGAYITFSQTK